VDRRGSGRRVCSNHSRSRRARMTSSVRAKSETPFSTFPTGSSFRTASYTNTVRRAARLGNRRHRRSVVTRQLGPSWVILVALAPDGQRPLDPSYRTMSTPQRTGAVCQIPTSRASQHRNTLSAPLVHRVVPALGLRWPCLRPQGAASAGQSSTSTKETPKRCFTATAKAAAGRPLRPSPPS
jgi:hypothetical protein